MKNYNISPVYTPQYLDEKYCVNFKRDDEMLQNTINMYNMILEEYNKNYSDYFVFSGIIQYINELIDYNESMCKIGYGYELMQLTNKLKYSISDLYDYIEIYDRCTLNSYLFYKDILYYMIKDDIIMRKKVKKIGKALKIIADRFREIDKGGKYD